jgi:hypothetical protein
VSLLLERGADIEAKNKVPALIGIDNPGIISLIIVSTLFRMITRLFTWLLTKVTRR